MYDAEFKNNESCYLIDWGGQLLMPKGGIVAYSHREMKK